MTTTAIASGLIEQEARALLTRLERVRPFALPLGSRQIVQVPSGGIGVTQAVNEGKPLILHQARTPIARALQGLADQVRSRIAAESAPRR